MAWRLANALTTLRDGVNARWPNRDRRSDGTIGDAAHATRTSDHNPWLVVGGVGVVRAFDADVDGIDAGWYAEQLRLLGAAGDSRLTGGGYVIYNRRITRPDWSGWSVYTGSNPHTSHVHVSLSRNPAGFDRTDPWAFLAQHEEEDMTLTRAQADELLYKVHQMWEAMSQTWVKNHHQWIGRVFATFGKYLPHDTDSITNAGGLAKRLDTIEAKLDAVAAAIQERPS